MDTAVPREMEGCVAAVLLLVLLRLGACGGESVSASESTSESWKDANKSVVSVVDRGMVFLVGCDRALFCAYWEMSLSSSKSEVVDVCATLVRGVWRGREEAVAGGYLGMFELKGLFLDFFEAAVFCAAEVAVVLDSNCEKLPPSWVKSSNKSRWVLSSEERGF